MSDLTTRSREAAQRDIAVVALEEVVFRDTGLSPIAKNALARIAEIEATALPQAPPGGSAMERATQAYKTVLERMEEELPGYQGSLPFWTILDVYGRAIEQAEREARAAERQRCLHWAAGSAHTAEYVVNAIESGAPPLATVGEP